MAGSRCGRTPAPTRNTAMLRALTAALVTTTLALAQTCPGYNEYPIRIVNALGQPYATATNGAYQGEANNVYMAFDTGLPDGAHRFYVFVTSGDLTAIASTDPYQNRVVDVVKTGNNITLNFPFAVSTVETGLGLNGVGQSVKLSFTSAVNPSTDPCHWKAWFYSGFATDMQGLPLDPNSPYQATPGTYPNCRIASYQHFEVANCGGTTTTCDGHTIGFWRNNHGRALVTQYGLLAQYSSLNLVNANGTPAAPFASLSAYASWLQRANATNMAYMLSAQLVGMYNNVAVGNVDMNCQIHHPTLGNTTIGQVMAAAVASLGSDPYTPSGHAQRAYQTALKDALDAANNNINWGWL